MAAGWTVDGPTATDAGGLTITLRHAVSSAEEASNLLASLGPPFVDVRLTRTSDGDATTTELSGQLVLENGFDSFADSDLLTAAGGTPFAADLDHATTPEQSMSVQLRTHAARRDRGDDRNRRRGRAASGSAPARRHCARPDDAHGPPPGPTWASILSITALVLLGVWVVLAGAFLVSVARVRRRRARRRGLGDDSARRLEELGERS